MEFAFRAQIAYEDLDTAGALHYQRLLDNQPEFAWTQDFAFDAMDPDPEAQPDIDALARKRYRERRRGEAVFISSAVLLLMLGEVAALGGLLQNGTEGPCGYLFVTAAATASSLVMVTVGAGRDVVHSFKDKPQGN